jgi:large subunit ribosomal protein L24
MKLKKGDSVKVVRGKDKGKTGKIDRVFPKINKVLVNGVNLYKRHLKARSQTKPSEIVTLTKPLPEENVILICPKCHKETRVGYRIEKKVKSRICKKCDAEI